MLAMDAYKNASPDMFSLLAYKDVHFVQFIFQIAMNAKISQYAWNVNLILFYLMENVSRLAHQILSHLLILL